jgi:serine/threonine kinase 32
LRFGGDIEQAARSVRHPLKNVSPSGSRSSTDEIRPGPEVRPVNMRSQSSPRNQPLSVPSSADGSPPAGTPLSKGKSNNYRNAPNFSTPQPHPQSRNGRPSRTASSTGGMQVVLGETGSWSDLAKQDATLPADAKDLTSKPKGMLGFFARKNGRGHSPKPQERGILGKEGARVVISGGG